jgi:uncharacterized phage protein (TIGR02218 family)
MVCAGTETVATYWRIMRRDGVTLGFSTRDLWFDNVAHLAAPGMMPAAIRRTCGLDDDLAEIHGAISHDAISSFDLQSGRFDGARVIVGVVDWETMEHQALYRGEIGTLSQQEVQGFVAELASSKAELARDPIPAPARPAGPNFVAANAPCPPHVSAMKRRCWRMIWTAISFI